VRYIENRKVGEVMTPYVITASTGDSVRDIARILSGKKISSVGVKDSGGNIVGIISQRDILREFDRDFDKVTAESIMSSPVISIDPNATLREAMEILSEKGIHRLLVTVDGKPVGLLSTSDIMQSIKATLKKPVSKAYVSKFKFGDLFPEKREVDVRDRKIEELMTTSVVYVDINSTVREVAGILAEKHIHGVVVTSEDGEMVGIVSDMDIIKAVGKDLDQLVAGDIMSSPIKTIEHHRTLRDAARLMTEHHIHRLLILLAEPGTETTLSLKRRPIMLRGIMDGASIPVGILSASDIVKGIAESR